MVIHRQYIKYQISNELYIPYDKVSSIMEAPRTDGRIQINRPLS